MSPRKRPTLVPNLEARVRRGNHEQMVSGGGATDARGRLLIYTNGCRGDAAHTAPHPTQGLTHLVLPSQSSSMVLPLCAMRISMSPEPPTSGSQYSSESTHRPRQPAL
jgi:hypothetical protein